MNVAMSADMLAAAMGAAFDVRYLAVHQKNRQKKCGKRDDSPEQNHAENPRRFVVSDRCEGQEKHENGSSGDHGIYRGQAVCRDSSRKDHAEAPCERGVSADCSQKQDQNSRLLRVQQGPAGYSVNARIASMSTAPYSPQGTFRHHA